MHHTLRLAAGAALLLALSGCNNVVSNDPWFTAADAEEAPVLRGGLWVMVTEDPCRVNLEKPAERWPDCADPFYVRGREWLAMNWDDSHRHKRVFEGWESLPILLAAGDPAILQLDESTDGPASEPDAEVIVIDDGEPDWRYSYAALRPTELDSQGRVVAFEFWSVQCGPSPESGPDDPILADPVTKRPFPGLTLVGQKCVAESADALRRAAVASRSLGQPVLVRWVRDGWH